MRRRVFVFVVMVRHRSGVRMKMFVCPFSCTNIRSADTNMDFITLTKFLDFVLFLRLEAFRVDS